MDRDAAWWLLCFVLTLVSGYLGQREFEHKRWSLGIGYFVLAMALLILGSASS